MHRISPAARFILESHFLKAEMLVGTGKNGIISKGDVLSAISKGLTAPAVSAISAVAPAPQQFLSYDSSNASFADIPNNNMRKVIAKRLASSKMNVPHFYTSIACNIDKILKLRAELKRDFGVNVSVNDIVIKASAMALKSVPQANGKWDDKLMQNVYSDVVDISVAVATPNGLITPIVTNVDKRGLYDINTTVKELAGRAKDGKLKPEEFQGGTFTISNLGMFGVSEFSAVINQPQSCILAVGGGIPTVLPPLAGETEPRVSTSLTVQLSADRRVLDEGLAAKFLQSFQLYLSNPTALVL